MSSSTPPRLATWMLLHLTAGDQDEALAGDLIESYRTGRSDSWYWRQTLAACLLSWGQGLKARLPLIVFALAWSIAAPAWELLCSRAMQAPAITGSFTRLGAFWAMPALIVWTMLHASFVWAGALVYSAAHGSFGPPLRGEKMRRGLLVAPVVLDVVYVVIFILVALYRYSIPALSGRSLALTMSGRIADIHLLPDLMRVPYFLALMSALWAAVAASPRYRVAPHLAVDSTNANTSSPALQVSLEQQSNAPVRFLFLLVAAGSINAVLAGFLLCRLSTFHAESVASLFMRAVESVALGLLGGSVGTWLYWKSPWSPYREQKPFSPGAFVLVCASAWVWAPAAALFSDQFSSVVAIVAAIGAYLLFGGLRDAAPLLLPDLQPAQSAPAPRQLLFADTLASPRLELHGYLIAVALYAGCAAILRGANHAAAALLALCAAVFAWNRPAHEDDSPTRPSQSIRRFATRLAAASLLAVLVTAWALMDEVDHRKPVVSADTNQAVDDSNHSGDVKRADSAASSTRDGVGYESLILYPFPEKRAIAPPTVSPAPLLTRGAAAPVTIRFTGTYRYVQPPNKHPGPHAHHAYGTPVDADIESNNAIPVTMDAHQEFAAPIQTRLCRTIQVDVANFDNIAGPISLALLLSNGLSGRAQTLYLGQQPLHSTQAGHFSFKTQPLFETLSFAVPAEAALSKFDEITVVVLSDSEHSHVAPRIAIRAFHLFPR